ncbi:MAG: SulP family inorganic anion transporter [Methyloglobulus sp.]|nr:SulP family inorganic anion transporter [Methyloglobulus sp.]
MFREIKYDLPASIVVFFVAVPLCLGIALASGAPLFAGIIAGVIGGIVVGLASGSALGVSGPGNGLTILVLTSIAALDGSWQAFLTAVVLAGIMQFLLGYFEAGFIAYFFPSSVIKGMLAGIGLLIILKQIPHALGYDKNVEGDFSFFQEDGETTISALTSALEVFTPGAVLISIISIAILIFWEVFLIKRYRIFQVIQGSLVSIMLGIALNYSYQQDWLNLTLSPDQLVNIPVPKDIGDFFGQFTFPDFSALARVEAWKAAVLITIIASLETLLSVEAADRLDPHKRTTPPNRELMAQGLGNILSGLCGGLPITQVIVRSSVNISFGAKTKLSAILHGMFILVSAITLAELLNMIPLASLAAILIVVGYKLTRPALYMEMYRLGWEQFIPFMATIIGMATTDLLKGITIGMVFGIFFTLRQSYYNSHTWNDAVTSDEGREIHHIVLAEELSFFTKASLLNTLSKIPKNANVIIDASKTKSIAFDVLQLIKEYKLSAKTKNIHVETINIA